MKILVSACLLEQKVRYNAENVAVDDPRLGQWAAEGHVVAICPEVAGGLPVPRPPAEIANENPLRVLTRDGIDCTREFVTGAEAALALAQAHGIRVAVLKEASPSCGTSYTYDGTFSRTRRPGVMGVTARLLAAHGIAVFSENELDAVEKLMRG